MSALTRRHVLVLGGVASLAALLPARSARAGADERPNVLWLVSEDNDPWLGAYGDPLAHTPNLDALAKRGILYRNAYSNAPVCAPSRFGIITGVKPESCAPAQHMRARATLPAFMRGFPEYLREAGYYCTNNAKTDYNSDLDPAKVWNESGKSAHWKNRAPGQPFFAVFNNETTHESRLFKPTEGRVKPEDVRVPAYLPDTPEIRRDYASYYNLIERMDAEIGAKLQELADAGLADDTIVFHYSDNGGVLPRSKRFCFDEGLRCVLMVYVPPKWRHLAAVEPGTSVTSPVGFIDLAPTMLSLAGVPIPSHMQGRAFLGPQAATAQRFQFGMRDRMDERYDMTRTVTDGRYRYTRNYQPHRPWGQHYGFAWLAAGYQSWEREYRAGRLNEVQARFFGPKPFESFHDLEADPDQLRNLIDAKEHAARIDEMRGALDAHMLGIVDNGFIPEGSALEGYEPSRRAQAYPLKEAMALAAVAARRDPRGVRTLRAHLAHESEVLRWWAAQGLVMLGARAKAARAELKSRLATETSPYVRVSLAEALVNTGEVEAGLRELTTLAAPPDAAVNPRVQLMALNALTYVGEAARPAFAAIARVEKSSKDEYCQRAAAYLRAVLDGSYAPDAVLMDLSKFRG
jgi:arylsulfatase A-like enzyme